MQKNKSEDNLRYAAIIEYYDKFNRDTYEFVSGYCSPEGPEIGKYIDVFYNPEKPGEGYDDVFSGLWLPPILFSAGAVAALVCVIFFGWKYYSRFLKPSEPSPASPQVCEENVDSLPPIATAQVVGTTQIPSKNNNVDQMNSKV